MSLDKPQSKPVEKSFISALEINDYFLIDQFHELTENIA